MLDGEHDMAEVLTKYGFSLSETRLYLEMLRKQEISAGELHRITGQSRPRTYELINQMVLKGFCQQRVEGRRKYYSAIKPSRLRALMQQKWDQEQKREEELFTKMDSVFDGGRDNSQSMDFIEVIRTKDLINHSFVTLVNEAQVLIQSFVCRPFSGLTQENWHAQRDALENANARGVEVHAIYSTEDMETELLQRAHRATQQLDKSVVRFKSSLPAKMFVFDHKKVLLAIPSIPGEKVSDFTMMVLEDESNASVYSELFKVYWDGALEYNDWVSKVEASTS
jgi:HTH-type transcriptional regulator, sugar sensing transcriptional regulator